MENEVKECSGDALPCEFSIVSSEDRVTRVDVHLYEVEDELLEEDERHEKSSKDSSWITVSVMLQPDRYGLGVNVKWRQVLPWSSDQRCAVIDSFRRRERSDVGPAEQSGKVFAGDVLLQVDDRAIHSLDDLLQCAQAWSTHRAEHGHPPYVLLKIRRQQHHSSMGTTTHDCRSLSRLLKREASMNEPIKDDQKVPLMQVDPGVAVTMRALQIQNQALVKKLMDANLVIAKQEVQLSQLESFNSKNNLDKLLESQGSSFATLSKKLSSLTRLASAGSTESSSESSPLPTPTGVGGIHITISPQTQKLHNDIELAVGAERTRMERWCDNLLKDQREDLEKKHTADLEKLRQIYEQKLVVLEKGFQSSLEDLNKRLYDLDTVTQCSDSCLNTRTLHVALNRHRTENHRPGSILNQQNSDCMVCNVLNEVNCHERDTSSPQEEYMSQILKQIAWVIRSHKALEGARILEQDGPSERTKEHKRLRKVVSFQLDQACHGEQAINGDENQCCN